MNTKHTPGPFRLVAHPYIPKHLPALDAVYGEVGGPVCYIPKYPRASMGELAPHESYEKTAANKFLILAAPELMTALANAVSHDELRQVSGKEPAPWFNQARAALEKVRGE